MNPRIYIAPAIAVLVLAASVGFALDPPPITDLTHFFVFNSGGIPGIDESWRLKVDGAVATPLSLDLPAIKQYPATTEMATLECYIPGGTTLLVGNAVWTGVSLKALIEAAGPLPEANSVRFYAVDGYLSGDFSLKTILSSDALILAYEMNGQTLPLNQGYPLRLVVPGAGGFNWAQWVRQIEITTAPPTLSSPICRSMHASCGPSRTYPSPWAITPSAAWPSPGPGGRSRELRSAPTTASPGATPC